MTPEIMLLCLLAALLELDTTYAFQLTFSRGIITGPILGLVTGDWMAGIQAGVFTELLFIDINPLGAILPPSAVICCAVAVGLKAMGIALCYSFLWGVLGALAFSHLEQYLRKQRVRLLSRWEHRLERRPGRIYRLIAWSLVTSFATNLVLISAFIWLSSKIMLSLQPHIPHQAFLSCQFVFMAVPWIGLASLIPEFRLKKR